MRVIAGQGAGGALAWLFVLCASLALLASAVAAGSAERPLALVCVGVALAATTRRTFLSWRGLVAALIVVILFIPIRRYTVPGNLPFQLEPYRILVALLVIGWLGSLLTDPRVQLRKTGFEGPIALIVATSLGSVLVNPQRFQLVSSDVNKKLMFFASFLLVLYLVASVIRQVDAVEHLIRTLVIGGSVVAVFSVIEARTGFNVFNHLHRALPMLKLTHEPNTLGRGAARLRVFGSAQHPIALSAALVMLTPLSLYLARRYRQKRWWACSLACVAAVTATVSRTGVMMLVVVVLVFLWLRPRETRQLWPALLPALVVIHFALPGTIGSLTQAFFPSGGLVAQQESSPGASGSGRLADVGPALDQFKLQPLFGQGFGTRVVNPGAGAVPANVLDDQWLGSLLETGVAGVAAWLWFFGRAVRRFGREAKRDTSDRGWLLAALAAGIAAYAVGMLTYDAFSFIQVTFLLFFFIGLGSAVYQTVPEPAVVRSRVQEIAPEPSR